MAVAGLFSWQDLLVVGLTASIFGVVGVLVVRLLWRAGSALSHSGTPQRFCPNCGARLPGGEK
jgi:hypothetical protein